MLVYRRVTGLAGHTSRVSELLEQVCSCSAPLFVRLSNRLLQQICSITKRCFVWNISLQAAHPHKIRIELRAVRRCPLTSMPGMERRCKS